MKSTKQDLIVLTTFCLKKVKKQVKNRTFKILTPNVVEVFSDKNSPLQVGFMFEIQGKREFVLRNRYYGDTVLSLQEEEISKILDEK